MEIVNSRQRDQKPGENEELLAPWERIYLWQKAENENNFNTINDLDCDSNIHNSTNSRMMQKRGMNYVLSTW